MKKVLIIEDEPALNAMLKARFEHEGYLVFSAFNGEEGYAKYRVVRPHLIILDLMIPKINGYEVCRKIRRETGDKKTPIMMLTAKQEDQDRIVGKVMGAQAYMTKPFDPQELMENARALMKDEPAGSQEH